MDSACHVISKNSSLNPRSKRFSPMLSLKTVYSFTFDIDIYDSL